MWLYYTSLKQQFLLSVSFRFSLMLMIYEKNHIFLVVFVWFAWLLSKYTNSFFLLLVRFVLLILDSSSDAATRGVLQKKLFVGILQYSLLLQYSIKQTAVVDYYNKVMLNSILILKAIEST